MPELVPWGYGGLQLDQQYRANEQTIQMNNLAMQESQRKADQEQQDSELQQMAADRLSKIAKGQSVTNSGVTDDVQSSYAGAFRQTGAYMAEMGAPDQAMKFFKSANEIDKAETDNAKARLDQQKNKAEILLKQSDIMARDLGNATNEDEWNQGLDAMEKSGIFPQEVIQQYKQMPFHPQAAAMIRQRALSVKDQATLDYQQQQEQRIQANADRTASIQMQRLAWDKQKAREEQRQKEIDAKSGKAAMAPNKDELRSAESAVVNLIFNGKPPKQLGDDGEDSPSYRAYQAGIQQIAASAKQMVRENKGLSWEAAISRATLQSKTEGDWDVQTQTHLIGDDDTTATFNGLGKEPEDALPMPMADDKPNTSALKKGRWYLSPTGKKGRWNGKGFDVMQ